MRREVRDAIESARSVDIGGDTLIRRVEPVRRHSFRLVRQLVLAVINELPDEVSLAELRDELNNRSAQDLE